MSNSAEQFMEVLKAALNKSYDELVEDGKYRLNSVMPVLNEGVGQETATKYVMILIATVVGADRKFSVEEYHYICDVLGVNFDPEDLGNFVANASTEKNRTDVDEILDGFPSDLKSSLLCFCLNILAVDGNYTEEEVDYLIRLLVTE